MPTGPELTQNNMQMYAIKVSNIYIVYKSHKIRGTLKLHLLIKVTFIHV